MAEPGFKGREYDLEFQAYKLYIWLSFLDKLLEKKETKV